MIIRAKIFLFQNARIVFKNETRKSRRMLLSGIFLSFTADQTEAVVYLSLSNHLLMQCAATAAMTAI